MQDFSAKTHCGNDLLVLQLSVVMSKESRGFTLARHPIVSSVLIATSFLSGPVILTATNKEPLHGPDRQMSAAFSSIRTALRQSDSEELFRIENTIYEEEISLEVQQGYIKKQAEAYNLTLVEIKPYLELLEDADNVHQVLSVLNAYTQELGFEIGIPNDEEVDADLCETIDPKKINVEEFKDGVVVFMNGLYRVPKEIIELSGLKSLHLVSSITSQKVERESAAVVDGDSLEVCMTLEDFRIDGAVYSYHEIGHLLDGVLVGEDEADEDEEFDSLNPDAFEYGDEARFKGVTLTSYGAIDRIEDKGVFYEEILGGLTPKVFRSPFFVIRKKGFLLLGRIEKRVEGYTAYLRAISLLDIT